mmetsp:Transcript_5967/g.17645  ORF Transcript_5967/g.17645 Transcript_5967/m.17645 type:complete len:168 (-) Transcript_5967:34-537(-)
MSADGIQWPECVTLVGVLVPTGFFAKMLSGGELFVFSVSGGQLQYNTHPKLAAYSVATAAAEIEATSFAWTLDNSTSLGDFLFDPRDPGCAKRQNVQGGLLGASVEKHSPTELTITVQQDPTPVRIRFLNEQDATTFESRVAENAVLCQQKFQASLETAVAAHQQGR